MTDEARTPEEERRTQDGEQPAAPEAASGTASQASDERSRAYSESPPMREDASEAPEADEGTGEGTDEGMDREIGRLRDEAQAHLEDARRIKAEFENYKKRMLREQTTIVERASGGLIERLLPVLDSFRLALVAADRTKNDREFLRGVELVYGELLEVLKKEGLEEIDAEGKPFDPEVHEAVMQVSSPDVPDGHVAEVMRTGYTVRGRVIRPAMVSVGKS
ncbi:MAG TPA: nucleotide exchange factor GrpE [Actinomycetota bacterium]|nr:nucleotide exchange factor GrpE [Actinomycetota bacterium]